MKNKKAGKETTGRLRVSLTAEVGSYNGIDDSLAKELKKIPKKAPFTRVVKTINDWAIKKTAALKRAELTARSKKLDFWKATSVARGKVKLCSFFIV